MRIADDLRQSVIFLGYRDDTPGKGGIDCIGTGFLLQYKGAPYLITAGHIAQELGGDPFLIRLNTKKGGSQNVHVDGLPWIMPADPKVDVAASMMIVPHQNYYDVAYFNGDRYMLSDVDWDRLHIGVGNLTYTIGLFRLLAGEKRNLPIAYMGNIALVPGDEKIPVVDWTDPDEQRIIGVDAFLVASQSLDGLSGSPVFVRPEINLNFPGIQNASVDTTDLAGPYADVRLLGVWQGSWRARPDQVMAAQAGDDVMVPTGVGIVVSCQKIIDLLETDEMQKARAGFRQMLRQETAATPESTEGSKPAVAASPASDTKFNHHEDFNSLSSAAVQSPGMPARDSGEN